MKEKTNTNSGRPESKNNVIIVVCHENFATYATVNIFLEDMNMITSKMNCLFFVMANSKGSTNIRDSICAGKHALLPPKCPFPTVSQPFTDYVSNNVIGLVQNSREGNTHHMRTSSESFLIEDQPSWLDDLLNEPDITPMRRGGHRRSSSDSFAYIDVSNARNLDYAAQEEYRYKNMISAPSWASLEFDYHSKKDARLAAFYNDVNLVKQNNRPWDLSLNAVTHSSALPSRRENSILQGSGSSCALKEVEGAPSTASEKQDSAESSPLEAKTYFEKKDNSYAKSSSSDSDTKRAKQCLEGHIPVLMFESVLGMVLTRVEHEVLEREIGRLRVLFQQQQQQQHQKQKPSSSSSSSHRPSSSRDLDSQFANLSLKHKDAN
ncbi:bZIP_1 domain-containing protein [Gossypium australe]|uniref:BZIP_1 domain-containing protein n=1 Tax=Gossypium australe TaxID=47621 RepID=A0A5B6V1I1_9ROSI|nr:bZIP_1 domain-containing protein [Gossypium australe]